MSLPVIAIIVAGASAVFTASNMFVSLATYRRGRPRVCMEAQWLPYIPVIGEHDGDTGFFLVHLVNKSQATVKVTRLYLRMEFERPLIPFTKRSDALSGLKIVKGDEEKEILPFGGVEWTIQTDQDSSRLVPHITRVKLTAILSNGTRVQSKWIRTPPQYVYTTQEMREAFDRYLAEREAQPQQLSLDDLGD
ncbi:hypothetical protein [Streptomyces phaeochromogenes]